MYLKQAQDVNIFKNMTKYMMKVTHNNVKKTLDQIQIN